MDHKTIQTGNWIIPLFLSLFILVGCAPAATPAADLTEVTVQLKWLHQSQFAGFYAADQNGYYSEEGLKVNFIEGGPTLDLENSVLGGQAQFGITGAENLIAAREKGEALQAIAVIYRRNPLVFMTLADSGITRPQQFAGKKIQYNATTGLILHAMLANVGVLQGDYSEVDVGGDLEPFYSGQVQVWNAWINNEVLTAIADGYEINIIYPDDYGIHFYSDTLFATEDTISTRPDLVLRFLRATLKGWTYAIENPDLVATMISKYNPNTDLQHQSEQMTASLPLINTGQDHIGWMKLETWSGMEQTLREQGVLTAPLIVNNVFTMQFLEEIYK